MSNHYLRVEKLANEEQLLRKKLKIESKIRSQRRRDKHSKHTESLKYSRILEPVTKSIEQLKNVEKITPKEENLIDLDEDNDDIQVLSHSEIDEKPGELYLHALDSIPLQFLDDGMFGLNVNTAEIGNNTFSVIGNMLTTQNKTHGTVNNFEINDLELWQLLLVQRPKLVKLDLRDKHGRDILREYKRIVNTLDLVQDAKNEGTAYANRAKFKLLNGKKGSGFLYSVRPPPFMFHPSTVVVPSDNKGLLRELLQALAELRAGNNSMQNIVVPLAREAKRKNILPPNLLTPNEMNWVFA